MQASSKIGDSFGAGILRGGGLHSEARVRGRWRAECYGQDGRLKWTEDFENIIVNEGLNHLLDSALAGQTQITSWYVGLKGTGTPAAADTMASHSSWSEELPRPEQLAFVLLQERRVDVAFSRRR